MTSLAHRPVTSAPAPTTRDVRGRAIAVAAAAVAILAVVAVVAVTTRSGQRLDEAAMNAVVAGRDTELTVLSLLGRISIGAVLAVMVCSSLVALIRGRVRLAVGSVAVIAGANLTTQAFKHVIDRPELGVDNWLSNSLPSGHTTVVASGVGALILVAPVAIRGAMACVGAFAVTATGASTIVAGWHRPADVIAACAVALAWTAAVSAVIGGPHHRSIGAGWAALIGSVIAVLGLVAIGVRPLAGWTEFALAGAVLGASTLVSAVTVTAMVAVSPTR